MSNKILFALFISLIAIITFFTFEKVNYENQKDLIHLLQNTSLMIFTVLGLWIAYAYPKTKSEGNHLKDLIRQEVPENNLKLKLLIEEFEEKYKELSLLLLALTLSAIVLGTLLLGVFLKSTFMNSDIAAYFSMSIIRFIATYILYGLVSIQSFSIYLVVIKNVNYTIELKNDLINIKESFKAKRK
jgi:Ni,Fe-hydrogenase I cytochrome b subunit